ncbi:MAG: RNA polymerase sigma factor [Pyrinomonadaceae bacterium]
MAVSCSSFEKLIEQAFFAGLDCHGDLGLEIEILSIRLSSVIKKYAQPEDTVSCSEDFFAKLHLNDLYLAQACAYGSEKAWDRFINCYLGYIRRLAKQHSGAHVLTDDLVDDIITNLYLPDRSGNSRIHSYDGRYSLSAWLRGVVVHRATNQNQLKINQAERLDTLAEFAGDTSTFSPEILLDSAMSHKISVTAWESVVNGLSDRERRVLLLLYDKGLSARSIAARMGLAPSTISYHTNSIYQKLRTNFFAILASTHQFSAQEIEECIAELMMNKEYSVLAPLLRSYNKTIL